MLFLWNCPVCNWIMLDYSIQLHFLILVKYIIKISYSSLFYHYWWIMMIKMYNLQLNYWKRINSIWIRNIPFMCWFVCRYIFDELNQASATEPNASCPVCPSVRPSRAGNTTKPMTVGLFGFHNLVAQHSVFWDRPTFIS